jgi:hypothetical protein
VDNGVVVQPKLLVDPVKFFAEVYEPAAGNELIGEPVAGSLTVSRSRKQGSTLSADPKRDLIGDDEHV